MASTRERLDVVLVMRGLAENRSKAQALVLAGRVYSGEQRLDKPGERIDPDRPLEIAPGPCWVGRGGMKLDGVLDRIPVDPQGRDCLDVGASTGGFTHVLLKRGAARVAAVDVGRGQLDWGLRNDPRVVVIEGLNARQLTPRELPFRPSLAVVDVSFISLGLIVPAILACLTAGGEVLALVKPQFEAGRSAVGPRGVIRDPAVHREVLRRMASASAKFHWGLRTFLLSSPPGAEGNREFFMHLLPGSPEISEAEAFAKIDHAIADASGTAS
jgi:23S rRNA (cytidine1920-2'-O)/16S rRNA (cytidine1409-2'-O)-methyltransferase